jgi:hypothetical protein
MFRYNGRSSAPDVSDLQEIISITDPLNLQYGNPNLKPSFNNRFNLMYNHYFDKSQMSMNANLSYSNTINSVANKMTYNSQTGGRTYTKTNVNGNWNTNGFFSFNTPLWDKRFTISSNSGASYSNAVSYTTVNANTDAVLSNTHNMNLNERLTTSFRNDVFDVSLNGGIRYNLTKNNKQTNSNRETFDYSAGLSTNVNLPWNIALSSDIDCSIKTGYSSGIDTHVYLWNAQLSKTFWKNNATIRFKIYDILREESNISRNISETMMSDTQYNTLGSYFMVHFVYRLNTLGGKAMRSERHGGFGGFGRGGFGGGHGGFGGGGFGGGRGRM